MSDMPGRRQYICRGHTQCAGAPILTTKYIGAAPGISDIAGGEQQDAARTDIRRAGRELGLSHGPGSASRAFPLAKISAIMLDLRIQADP